MASKWTHLPNAKHIDRILASVKANPDLWDAPVTEAEKVVRDAAWYAAWEAGREDAARSAAWRAAWEAAREAARNAMLALIAYDDCAHMLDSDIGELKILAAFGDPRAILLLPACIVFAKKRN